MPVLDAPLDALALDAEPPAPLEALAEEECEPVVPDALDDPLVAPELDALAPPAPPQPKSLGA